jgi:RNA polymerase sigma-70 factor (ECF subfamily)
MRPDIAPHPSCSEIRKAAIVSPPNLLVAAPARLRIVAIPAVPVELVVSKVAAIPVTALGDVCLIHQPLDDADFKAALVAAIPQLRAFGRLLSGNADVADDLVQDTMVKAWTARHRFIAGTNLRAWTRVILRNAYFSMVRRARFKGEWDPIAADLLLAVPAGQESHVTLADVQRAMLQLPDDQREALILMSAAGMTCENVAALTGCAVGTVKSRVARGRASLKRLLDGGQLQVARAAMPVSTVTPLDQIMEQARVLALPRGAAVLVVL